MAISKKSRRYPGVVVLLFIIAVLVVIFVDPWDSLRKSTRQILLTDPVKIDQVRIAGTHDTVTLSKSGEAWLLPGGELANMVAVENLIFAAGRVQVDAVESERSEWANGVIKEVSFLSKKKLVLQYKTLSREGRFLLQPAGSARAFAISLPGYPELELNQVFSDSENHYREHVIIDLLPKEIRLIEVEKRGSPSFRFSKDETGEIRCELPQSDSTVPLEYLDEESVRMLFTYFTSIRYEEKAGDLVDVPMDEEMGERWLASLHVESVDGENHTLQVYSLPGVFGEKDQMFRAQVIHNNNPEPLLIKYIYIDVLMRGLPAYFGDKPMRH